MYASWSERTLPRRLQYFDIKFTDYEVDIEDAKEAVWFLENLESPGILLWHFPVTEKSWIRATCLGKSWKSVKFK